MSEETLKKENTIANKTSFANKNTIANKTSFVNKNSFANKTSLVYKKTHQEVSKQFVQRFLLEIGLYAACVLIVLVLGYLWCEKYVWYKTDMLYPLIHEFHIHWVSFVLFAILFGCLVISCINFSRIAKMMGQIVQAVDDMHGDRVNYITLSPQLYEVEEKLNRILDNERESKHLAKEAERRKNDMVIYMAHDLKTPLTSVMGYLMLLNDESEISPELRKKYISIILNKAGRLEELINEFFEAARYNFSEFTLNYSKVNMSMMAEQILYEFKPLLAEKGMEYKYEAGQDIMVSCDVEQMERVFDNLIKNAINYSYENSTLFVSLEKRGEDGMRITVKNQGKTIPKEKIEHIFEQFFRLDASRSSNTGGSGLGLAIAKQIVEMHGGTISCESENETITFILEI